MPAESYYFYVSWRDPNYDYGYSLARVAKPERLKAELRIPQTQARDVQVGQSALIDTRTDTIPGRVRRVDPNVQQAIDQVRKNSGWLMFMGVALIILGVVGLGMVGTLTLASVFVFGWLIIVAGVLVLVDGFKAEGWKAKLWEILIALLYIAAGVIVLVHPAASAVWFTMLLAIFLIGAALFCNQLKSTPLFTLPSDLYPARDVATVWGMFGAAGSFGAVLFSPVIGWVADNFSYTPVFIVVSVLPLGSAAVIAVFIPRIRRQDTVA